MTATVQYLPSAYTAMPLAAHSHRAAEASLFLRQQPGQEHKPDAQIIDAEWQPVHEPVFYPGPALEASVSQLFVGTDNRPQPQSLASAAGRYQQMQSDYSNKNDRASGQHLDIFA